jgi:hypothetical protein
MASLVKPIIGYLIFNMCFIKIRVYPCLSASNINFLNFLDLSQGITSPKGILYKKDYGRTIASEYSNHKKGGNGYGQ